MISDEVVELRAVSRWFTSSGGPVVALDDVDLVARRGRLTIVAGTSGSGKSTLLGLVGCIDRPHAGTIDVCGHDVATLGRRARRLLRRRSLAVVLPVPADNLLPASSTVDNLRWTARRRGVVADRLTLLAALESVGLAAALSKPVAVLSGGEQQRLALALALLGDPAVVIADEPTASLDRTSAGLVVEAIRSAASRGVTLLVATHDHHLIEAADDLVVLDHGRRIR